MSTGAFLEFLTGMQASETCSGAWAGPQKRLKCWSEDGTPLLMELYSSAFGNHPRPPKVSGLGVMVLRPGPMGYKKLKLGLQEVNR